MKEEWQDIVGYEGLYQVSNLGRVKSLKYGKERILKYRTCSDYLYVTLYKNGNEKQFKIHRLVAEAFIPNPDNLPMVNHKNEIKTDNSASNLEYCTARYNTRYSSAKKIGCFKDGKLIKSYEAVIDVEKDGFNRGNVCNALKGRYNHSGGYQWKYLE